MIAFFHQNPVFGQQGGIERYIATLADYGRGKCMLVIGNEDRTYVLDDIVHVKMCGPISLPRWTRFLLGVFFNISLVRREMNRRNVRLVEFSRPELLALAPLLVGKKVVTMHGTGPSRLSKGKYLIHHVSSALIPLFAKRVQVIGRDKSALHPWLQKVMSKNLVHIDAWYDDAFTTSPPPAAPPFRIFYAGRLNGQKNPDLLAEVLAAAKKRFGAAVEFVYAGSNYEELARRGCQDIIKDCGLMNAEELNEFMRSAHSGILCSGYGEGSPFIIAETLACGRAFITSPLPTVLETYSNQYGVVISRDWTVSAFLDAIQKAMGLMGHPESYIAIGQGIDQQSASHAVPRLLDALINFSKSAK